MRTKQKAAVLLERRLARDRTEAYHDARALAIELARGEAPSWFDPMGAGVVLQPGETVYRQVPLWIRVKQDGTWADASFADVIVTDLRLLSRFESRRLTSLWWGGVIGLNVDLAAEFIILDFGDSQPVGLSGAQVALVSVMAVASIYGAQSMASHPALAPLRTRSSGTAKPDPR